MPSSSWPALRSYSPPFQAAIAMPLGGIGAGSVSLGGHGELIDWELFNRPSKGFTPCSVDAGPGVMLHMKPAQGPAQLRLAEGPVETRDYPGCVGTTKPNHGIPRFQNCRFDAAYPLAQVHLQDDNSPLTVRLEAFSPVIPGNADDSSLPVIQLRYHLHNSSAEAVDVAAIANLPNFIGMDPQSRQVLGNGRYAFSGPNKNRIEFREDAAAKGLYFYSEGVDDKLNSWGTLSLCTDSEADVSYRRSWLDQHYHSALLDFYNDLESDGRLDDREHSSGDVPTGSLAVHHRIPPGESRSVRFFLCWHFPNRMDWTPGKHDIRVGSWYSERFTDAWDAARQIIPRLPQLEHKTVEFVRAFCGSDLPIAVKEAMLFNLSTLFTETCHRLPDGTFCGFEGCGDHQAYCEGSCTHVWNYEHCLPFMFGELAQTMRSVEFEIATGPRGDMAFRAHQPFAQRGRDFARVAADGQMGCIVKAYREWQLSGDTLRMLELWPKVRKSLEYCWIENGWDSDCDGVMEGCQHNTMDVEYYGPNPQMQGWYLAALLAAAAMSEQAGDAEFAKKCRTLFQHGSRWMDEHLFNGEYYEQRFQPPVAPERIPAEQRLFNDKAIDDSHQLLDGCLVDQLVGQTMAHICGLGDLLDPQHIATTFTSIARYNQQTGFRNHFNPMRSFALGDEKALLMASFPRNPRPEFPFPYFAETMTGFEYTAAAGMIYAGQREAALEILTDIRSRYDGNKRNPFNEPECGHHYARAMASWASGLAWTGFHFSAPQGVMTVNGEEGCWFWSNGYAWGTYRIRGDQVTLRVLYGKLKLNRFTARAQGSKQFAGETVFSEGEENTFTLN
ncbi:GH116 family glycosyl-hydrolase [Elongatibacter sediminis]|uniref:GH116 family glycosyl-hydrolase n=1 Tax=Elongatibacter sediminis TaxID=3119006 RepID=A0AAW9RB09_9GAMM